jgi:CheY-like chemotaxis protein
MGGDIEVTSRKGEGSRFSVSLRVKKGGVKRVVTEKAKSLDQAKIASNKEAFGGLSVLLVEDVEMNILLAQEIFSRFFGFTPDVARNGLEAIERVQAREYDLVFMDIQMPKMGGIEATRKIRELGVHTPIVAMTANALASDLDAAKAAGMDDYVTKPILHAVIEKVLVRIASEKASSKRRAS